MLRWWQTVTMSWLYEGEQGILAYDAVSLNLPQTNIWSQPSRFLTLGSLNGDRLSSIYRPCLWGVKCVLMAKRWAACLKVRNAKEEARGREVLGEVKIHYIYTDCRPGWLSIWNCKSFPLYLASSFLPLLLLSALHLFYQQNAKWLQTQKRKQKRQCQLTTGQNTRLKMTKHIYGEIILTHPPCWISYIAPFPFPLPVSFTPTTCPFQKT